MNIVNLKNNLSVIKVSGDDSVKYLQGQLTNDINQLDNVAFQYSAHLNNKGRMLASFIITKVETNCYYLITATEIIDKILPRLKMFILRSKVSMEILDENIYFYDEKFDDKANIAQDAKNIVLNETHYLTITCQQIVTVQEVDLWKQWLIHSGVPMIYLNTQETFTPQQVNYDLIGGVNFKKGCYTGQEIVARMHYLGKVKRRMYEFTTSFDVYIGQKIYSPVMNNQEVGEIVEAACIDEKWSGLISVQIDCIEVAFLDVDNLAKLDLVKREF